MPTAHMNAVFFLYANLALVWSAQNTLKDDKGQNTIKFEEAPERISDRSQQTNGIRTDLNPRSKFEGCRTPATPRELVEEPDPPLNSSLTLVENADDIGSALEDTAAEGTCPEGMVCCDKGFQVVLEKDGLNGASASCCKSTSSYCAGCASLTNPNDESSPCFTCVGGYQKITKYIIEKAEAGKLAHWHKEEPPEEDTCAMCADTAHWLDGNGNACQKSTCETVPHNGLSADQACCKCGGGQWAATPFSFPAARMRLLGEMPELGPIPRTANKYTLDRDCAIGKHGIQLDGQTGMLKLMEGCASVGCGRGSFKITCTLTAHQTPTLSSTTRIVLTGTYLLYPDDPIILVPGNPWVAPMAEAAPAPAPTAKAFDTLSGKYCSDDWRVRYAAHTVEKLEQCKLKCDGSSSCQAISFYKERCVLCDTTTVASHGAWTTYTKKQASLLQMQQLQAKLQASDTPNVLSSFCIPDSAAVWLNVDVEGRLVSSSEHKTRNGGGGISGDGLGTIGAHCFVKGNITVGGKSEEHDTTVVVFHPEIWPTHFSYGGSSFSVTVGEDLLPLRIHNPDKRKTAPHRFSVACSVTGATFAFDTVTGVATVDGHAAFTLDPEKGSLLVSPVKALEKVFDGLPHVNSRKQLELTCRVIGYYTEVAHLASRTTTSQQLTIFIFDNTCWAEQEDYFVDPPIDATMTLEAEPKTSATCRTACRHSQACTSYQYVGSKCFFMAGLCSAGSTKNKCVSRNAWTKIPGCGEQSSCIALVDDQYAWVSGRYCAAGEATGGRVYYKEGVTVPDTLYLAKYDAQRDTGTRSLGGTCSVGQYIIKQWSTSDFEDPTTDRIDLKGGSVKCIGSETPDFVANVFDIGFASAGGEVTGRISASSCGPPNMTVVNAADDEDGDDKDVVPTLVLDDPSTPESEDFWLHPCDCFPETWGDSAPVTDDSMSSIPAGSGNKCTPAPVILVDGAFTCAMEYLLHIVPFSAQDGQEASHCEYQCKGNPECNFFWDGDVAGGKQCRLYRDCGNLVREVGLHGKLVAVPRHNARYCALADPTTCWKVSGRRSFLGAAGPSTHTHAKCAWLSIVQQCDHKLLMGGLGVEACMRCTHREFGKSFHDFEHKQPLPEGFSHGEHLLVSCWRERFRAVSLKSGAEAKGGTLTCVSGRWFDGAGQPGLSNLACGACIQVVGSKYVFLDAQNKQELYFASKIPITIWVMGGQTLGLKSTGKLSPGAAQQFIMKPAHGRFSLRPSQNTWAACLELYDFKAELWSVLHDWQCYLDGFACYVNRYADLGHLGKHGARYHYEHHGRKEGRVCTCPGAAKATPLELVRFKLVACSTSTRQAFSTSDIPAILMNEVAATRCKTHRSTEPAKVSGSSSNWDVWHALLNCEEYGIGAWTFFAADNTMWWSVSCRPSTAMRRSDAKSANMDDHKCGTPCKYAETKFEQPRFVKNRDTFDPPQDTSHIKFEQVAWDMANIEMQCAPGTGLSFIEKRGRLVNWRCNFMAASGACHTFFTAQADILGVADLSFASQVSVNTPNDEMLQSIEAERSGTTWFRYRYVSCLIAGLPISILPTPKYPEMSFADYEGIYCPVSRDDSERLTFNQIQRFGAARLLPPAPQPPVVEWVDNQLKVSWNIPMWDVTFTWVGVVKMGCTDWYYVDASHNTLVAHRNLVTEPVAAPRFTVLVGATSDVPYRAAIAFQNNIGLGDWSKVSIARWVVGERGNSCGHVCFSIGLACESNNKLTSTAQVTQAFKAAGHPCESQVSEEEATGTPFTTLEHLCNRRASDANCNSKPQDAQNAALCFCKPKEGGVACTDHCQNYVEGGTCNSFCQTCGDYRSLLNGKCVKECPEGYYRDTPVQATGSKCNACHTSCLLCDGAGEHRCNTCRLGVEWGPCAGGGKTGRGSCKKYAPCSNPCCESMSTCEATRDEHCTNCRNSNYVQQGSKCMDKIYDTDGCCQASEQMTSESQCKKHLGWGVVGGVWPPKWGPAIGTMPRDVSPRRRRNGAPRVHCSYFPTILDLSGKGWWDWDTTSHPCGVKKQRAVCERHSVALLENATSDNMLRTLHETSLHQHSVKLNGNAVEAKKVAADAKKATILSGSYTIQMKYNKRYLDAWTDGHDYSVVTRTAQNDDSQKWVFEHIANGVHSIRQKQNMRYVDAWVAGDHSVVTRTAENDNSQKWLITRVANGVYTIQMKQNMRYFDAHVHEAQDYSVVTRTAQNDDSQKWIIKKEAAPPYLETAYGQSACPSGYQAIANEAECKTAGTSEWGQAHQGVPPKNALDKVWGGTNSDKGWGNIQADCFSHSNKKIWWNKLKGTDNGAFSSICALQASTGLQPNSNGVKARGQQVWSRYHYRYGTCDWQCYLDRYGDLQKAFGPTGTAAAKKHYGYHGRREGRVCTCPNSAKAYTGLEYAKAFNAIGCPNPSSSVGDYWMTVPEQSALYEMYAYCELNREKKAEKRQKTLCCGSDIFCAVHCLKPTSLKAAVEAGKLIIQGSRGVINYNRQKAQWCIAGSASSHFCITSIAGHPLDGEYAGKSFAIVQLSDFDGEFEAKGVGKPKVGKRTKPKLIKFASSQPEYAEECKDESYPGANTFDLSTMNKVGLALPGANPCSQIAGKWVKSGSVLESLSAKLGTVAKLTEGLPGNTQLKLVSGLLGMAPSGDEKRGFAWTTYSGTKDIRANLPGMSMMLGGGGGSDGEQEAGVTYKAMQGCASRSKKLGKIAKKAEMWFKHVKALKGMVAGFLTNSMCPLIPSTVVAPLGGGLGFDTAAEFCAGTIGGLNSVADWALLKTDEIGTMQNEAGVAKDCGADEARMANARMFCDLHCIRDAVKAGNEAILGSLSNAVDVLGRNMDMLMNYYTGTVHDTLAVLTQNQAQNQAQIMKQQAKVSLTELSTMFGKMNQMLGSRLHAAGHATASRALESFVVRFSSADHTVVTNASQLLNDLTSEVDHLMNTISVASTNQLSTSGEVARRTTAGLDYMSEFLSAHNDLIGVYRTAAEHTKKKQDALSVAGTVTELKEEVEVAAAKTILRDTDRSWWAIREKIDLYWESEANRATAFGDALTVLDRYTLKCTSDLIDVNNVEAQAMEADDAARIQLHDTWHSVVHELGLLTAMIVDSDGFLQLGRLDTLSVNAPANRTTMCGSGRFGQEAVLSAVEGALKTGLAYQTWEQLRWIFVEMSILRERFASEGLQVPSPETLMQAVQRASKSVQGLLAQHSNLAVDVAARVCDRKQSLLQTSPQDSKDMKAVLKELQALHVVEELQTQHAADEKQHAADEKQHATDEKKLELVFAVGFGVMAVLVLATFFWSVCRK